MDPFVLPPHWELPPDRVTLGPRDVYVWAVYVPAFAIWADTLLRLLDAQELAHVGQFTQGVDRAYYVVRRAVRRYLIGYSIGIDASTVMFEHSTHGKPDIVGIPSSPRVCMNVSHSHDLMLLALTQSHEVGIDVEYRRGVPQWRQIVENEFTAAECRALLALEPGEVPRAFCDLWTCKEAYCKGRGYGLELPLSSFEISCFAGEVDALVCDDWDPLASALWSVRLLDIGTQYSAALAVQARAHEMRQRLWIADADRIVQAL